MAAKRWIRRMLERRGISYEVFHHAPAYTAQEVAASEHLSGHRLAKVVVVIADERPVELVLPASRHVSMNQIRGVLAAKNVRLASEEEMQEIFTDCEVGAIPPLPHGKEIEVVMDETLRVEGDIYFQAGTHEEVVQLKFEDWMNLVQPRVASFCHVAMTY